MVTMDLIGIRIPPASRFVSCDANGHSLAVGDACVVESERGLEFGIVLKSGLRSVSAQELKGIPRVIRRATQDDEEAYAHKEVSEREGREFCLARIAERKLPMKLGNVERQLDGKKMTFYFTADGRVDFRDLVRDLTGEFRTRIELRQIGARDDAGMQGGCGPCGRALCCADWLRGFDPVSIKMAKAQGLSLNPAKISGTCGRLMCCLKFEYDPKEAARRKAGTGAPPPPAESPAPEMPARAEADPLPILR